MGVTVEGAKIGFFQGVSLLSDSTRSQVWKWLFRVFCEEAFTTEAPSSQRSRIFSIKQLFTPRPPRLRGAMAQVLLEAKPEDPETRNLNAETFFTNPA